MKPIAKQNMAQCVCVLPGKVVCNVNFYKNHVFLMYDKKSRMWSLPNEEKSKDDYDTYDTISRFYKDVLGCRLRGLKTITYLKNNSDVVIYRNCHFIPSKNPLYMEWVPIGELENYKIDQLSLDVISQEFFVSKTNECV